MVKVVVVLLLMITYKMHGNGNLLQGFCNMVIMYGKGYGSLWLFDNI
jgi:hypothetical protein